MHANNSPEIFYRNCENHGRWVQMLERAICSIRPYNNENALNLKNSYTKLKQDVFVKHMCFWIIANSKDGQDHKNKLIPVERSNHKKCSCLSLNVCSCLSFDYQ